VHCCALQLLTARPRSKTSATVGLNSSVSWNTDVSVLPIGPILRGSTLEVGAVGNLETSVSNCLTHRNNPGDGRILLIFLYGDDKYVKSRNV
jgi:hypothetical protein